METVELREGEYLFRRGELDENIYVVQQGQVDVYIRERLVNHTYGGSSSNLNDSQYNDHSYEGVEDSNVYGNEWRVAEVKNGESIHSLLSVLDVITGHMAPYKTVSARATTQAKVIKLPVSVMKEQFKNTPDALIRLVQVIAMRLQRVTMFTLHNYLGLTTQLIKAKVNFDISDFQISKVDEVLERKRQERIAKRESALSLQRQKEQNSNLSVRLDPSQTSNVTSISNSDLGQIHEDNLNLYNPNSNIDIMSRKDQVNKKMTRFAELETVVAERSSKASATVYHRQSNLGDVGDEMSNVVRQAFIRENNFSLSQENRNIFSGPKIKTRYDSTMEIREYFNQEILDLAKEDITKKIFGLNDPSILGRKMTLLTVPQGSTLTVEGDYNAALYFVVKGNLAIIQNDENNNDILVYYCLPGMVSGQLAVLTGEPSMFSVKAYQESIVVRILKTDLFSILREHKEEASNIILNIGHSITSRMAES